MATKMSRDRRVFVPLDMVDEEARESTMTRERVMRISAIELELKTSGHTEE